MDPKACWDRLREAVRAGEREEAYEAACELADWLKAGGCREALPLVVDRHDLTSFARVMYYLAD